MIVKLGSHGREGLVGFRVGKGEGSRAGLLGVLVRAIGATSRRSSRLDALALLLYSRATFSPSYLLFPLLFPLGSSSNGD